MRLKGFAFVFKNRNEIKYYENNNELFKSPIGIYTTGREPEITLFSDIEWKEKVQEFIKDRKTELIQKIQDDKEISKWYQINI